MAADAPITVATVTTRLGLPGISLATAELACDKLTMKRRFSERGVPVPWFAEICTVQELQRVAIERGRNLVIKPVDSRGSRGVQRIAQIQDLAKAYALARSHSPTERVMVEEYLDGPQVSTESIVMEGRCYTPGFSDRNYEYLDTFAPFFIENGGDLPSHLPPDIQTKVRDVVSKAAEALGVTDGTVKGDIVVHNGEPYVIELAARLSGGFFCTREIPLNTGVDFIGCAIKVALGESVSPEELKPKTSAAVIQRYAFPKPGRVVSVSGAEEAMKITGITDVIITAKPGDVIPPAVTNVPPPRWCWRREPPAKLPWRRLTMRWPVYRLASHERAAAFSRHGSSHSYVAPIYIVPSQPCVLVDRRGTEGRGYRALLLALATPGGSSRAYRDRSDGVHTGGNIQARPSMDRETAHTD
ncbi:MAG: ATP-grasp domain-containing protein [Rhizomicrobium sp.]